MTIATSWAKALPPIPIKEDVYVTTNDLNQIKYLGLVFIIKWLWDVIVWLWNKLNGKDEDEKKDTRERLKNVENQNTELLSIVREIQINLAQVKDNQVTENEVREITRNELQYAKRLSERR